MGKGEQKSLRCFLGQSNPRNHTNNNNDNDAGFEPGRAIVPILHCNWNCPFKKRPRGQFVPFQILGKNSKAHTKKFISVQKLQAETERGKYILSHL